VVHSKEGGSDVACQVQEVEGGCGAWCGGTRSRGVSGRGWHRGVSLGTWPFSCGLTQ
jgi:hypothetical protein